MDLVASETSSKKRRFSLDKRLEQVFHTGMRSGLELHAAKLSGRPRRLGAMALTLALSLSTAGCLSPLAKHSVALSAATAPVVDQASAAYRDAQALHNLRVDYDAVAEFDLAQPVYNPRDIRVLLPDKDIQTRLAVLAALQVYANSLVQITNGTESPELDAASTSVAGDLTSLGNNLAPSIESVLGIAATPASTTDTEVTITAGNTSSSTSTTTATPTPAISPEVRNGISTAIDALGQYLVARKIKQELPQKIVAMDPHVHQLCKLLDDDIGILQDQEKRDYNRIINLQTLFIREDTKLHPADLYREQRRLEIMKLPEIVRQQRVTDERLANLRAAIVNLALTHHALAAEAQGNNPESLTAKLAELAAAGKSLGKYYSSLPAN
jgi:hypothetical protein